ncbi:hypothetical protein [Spirosoma sp. KNUC1025]|uniref:hypothetical protein n=1 Tax=Spirosoma sp. KNUC1025 TaxID=2894082 RepID=UPI00386AC7F0|nr:hypothetical protein LN737_28895 [Spirosoma sp. KNUC1025]
MQSTERNVTVNKLVINSMAQDRYILNFKGSLPLPDSDMQLIRSKTNLIDASRKTLLVEPKDDALMYELARELPDWTVKKEILYTIPSPNPTVLKPPKP